jgi:hypothetical protein
MDEEQKQYNELNTTERSSVVGIDSMRTTETEDLEKDP